MLISMVSAVPRNLTFRRRSARPLTFASSNPTAARGATQRLMTLQRPPSGLRGSYLGSGLGPSRSLRKMGSLVSSPDERWSIDGLYRPVTLYRRAPLPLEALL